MINKTMGTGGDYADFTALKTALQGTTLTDDLTVTVISSINQTVAANWATGSPMTLAGFTFRLTSSVNSFGNPTVGNLITFASTAGSSMYFKGPGALRVDSLNMYKNNASSSLIVFELNEHNTNTSTLNFRFDNLMIWANDAGVNGGLELVAKFSAPSFLNISGYNIILRNAILSCPNKAVGGSGFENVTAVRIAGSVAGGNLSGQSSGLALKNSYAQNISGWGAKSYNATADATATGTGSLINKAPLLQFTSLSPASPDFMKVLDTADIRAAGAAPVISGNTIGIRGNARPNAYGDISMGADQWPGLAPAASNGIMMPGFIPGF
jgi:hypothetical protein